MKEKKYSKGSFSPITLHKMKVMQILLLRVWNISKIQTQLSV